ncbi:glycosyltransferase [Reyranella sp. CPCC 100927]|uniref:glycosyltransferase n=1 Tax=Reyranella sp. CPCC 100927 TaxID=2599616 RepID=UPI0011B5DF04|nr:glycosyltransferase [Reyranella sp. CPCC 100927]TWT00726.1 glycosyltransferase [Reyranella sp. CPCC 100927]
MIWLLLLGILPLLIWLYLLLGRGLYWLTRECDDRQGPSLALPQWPSVTAVVPARNEVDVIARTIGSLLAQDYPGAFRVILVDDESDDGTAATASALDGSGRLTVMTGPKRPVGWTGKLWAVSQGIARATETDAPAYLWLTDADIAHAPETLRHLVARAQHDKRVLVSLMAKLHCTSWTERFYIPAFVYFFKMLYPFAWVNDPAARTAAAAGGCMLVRRAALEAAGGIAQIRSAIIDDCALGRVLKRQGPVWLGLTNRSVSIRPYAGAPEIRRMVARSAYAQLGYSPLLLLGTLLGLALVFLAPAAWAVLGPSGSWVAGAVAWALMAISFVPMAQFYDRSPLWGLALPAIALLYALFTLDSAIQHWRGRGGMWKGRVQAMRQA